MANHSSQYSCLKNHGQRTLMDYSPWGHKRIRHDLVTKQTNKNYIYIITLQAQLNFLLVILLLICPLVLT